MNHKSGRSAFSMLELIFVIVILGIVASIGSELIVRVYQQYIVQRAQHRASIKTELAATQIANRLASAIPGTVYRIKNDGSYESFDSNLSAGSNDDSYKGMQWVGADMDSFNYYDDTTKKVGWSGFCDVDASNTNIVSTPGSNLGMTDTIIQKLSGNTKTIADATIFFPYYSTEYGISSYSGLNITLDNNASTIVEHYKLAWSSYALVAEDNTKGGKDLVLYYNFAPSPATALGNNKSLLMKNISTFKFKGAGRTIRFKICKEENIGEDFNITSCKEKAVF